MRPNAEGSPANPIMQRLFAFWLLGLIFSPSVLFAQVLTQEAYPYCGVKLQAWERQTPPARWRILTVNLTEPGINYHISPVEYVRGPFGDILQSSICQTTWDFMAERPHLQLAFNGVAYYPFPAYTGGRRYLSEPVWMGEDRPQETQNNSPLIGFFHGRAQIAPAATLREQGPIIAMGAFEDAGMIPGGWAVRAGQVVADGKTAHARLVLGTSPDEKRLFLLTADGYDARRSLGLSTQDAAEQMLAAGAYQAIFLDGGGSTTLIARDSDQSLHLLNRPAGLQNRPGTLRPIAVSFGLSGLIRTQDELPAIPNALAPVWIQIRSRWINEVRCRPIYFGFLGLAGLLGTGWIIRWYRRNKDRRISHGK